MNERNNNFIGYEYNEVTIDRSLESVYVDSYQNFGWELEGVSYPIGSVLTITLKFKRDRKINNRTELTRLQRQFDSYANEIVTLERSKGIGPSAVAYVVGIVGTALMAGAVFAYLANMVPLMVILAIPGFAGWAASYFCYKILREKKITQVNPLIDKKYDDIYSVCEKANHLVNAI